MALVAGSDAACTQRIAINQIASTDVYTSNARVWFCSIDLISAAQQQVSIVEGAGTTCATGTQALWGATTAGAAAGMPLAVNGGFSKTAADPFAATLVAGDHLCILQSGTGLIGGAIWFTDHN